MTEQLRDWVNRQWPDLNWYKLAVDAPTPLPSAAAPDWTALNGDAGFRRYFRLHCQPSLLAVYSPPTTEPNAVFVQIAQHLNYQGLATPVILAMDLTQGFFILEDFGPTLLLQTLNQQNVNTPYQEAFTCLLDLQKINTQGLTLPHYDRVKLRQEMALLIEWFIENLLQYALNPYELNQLESLFAQLENSALEQPHVFVHRDFHARNLVYRPHAPLGIIDFQDAVIGPITYDLVSLLRDCYILWPAQQVQQWALEYAQLAREHRLLNNIDDARFLGWFDAMGLQRHIKVLGVFSRLHLRDQKDAYLNDLPRVIHYVLSVAQTYPPAQPFAHWFNEKLMPNIIQQPWWSPVKA